MSNEKPDIDPFYKEKIDYYYSRKVSLAGITSLLFMDGITGYNYFELRKYIQKHLNRLSNKNTDR
jgi:hypothetical protein